MSYYELFISVNPSNVVLHTVREKEKAYTDDQNDPAVVQPYAAYSPAGQVQVKSDITVYLKWTKLWFAQGRAEASSEKLMRKNTSET